YGEEAAHRYARMHVAVAPACHIQCHYCNRKYDCANESRPGVTSGVLDPEAALDHVAATQARLPHLRVVGVAGPGDALANPKRSFAFLEGLRRRFPELIPCLSTNGLALPGYVEELKRLDVAHVTVTVNCLDAAIGEAIYPWVFWKHRRRFGREAAAILLENQMEGLERAVAAGLMVKVNSVLIPGVNDRHLPQVNRVVSGMGVAIHNIMPLLAPPESATFYARMGQPVPDEVDLEQVRAQCGGSAHLMRHCRQCRADAAGLLGEEPRARTIPIARSTVSSEIFQVAVASRTGERVDEHFGHASAFRVYRLTPHGVGLMVKQRPVSRHCHGSDSCGESDSPLQRIIDTLRDCRAVVCERIGPDPQDALRAAGIEPVQRFSGSPVVEALSTLNREWRV
ncbi:MAG: nitrogenase cofactor biosynthesis protein NifB, partial [Magnetococcales bacterium]|nr:nitrogenase cofactor biosynthesis protein NifB [Magnetococcales bacterium]